MKINILRSSFQTDEFVWNEYAELIDRLKNEFQAEIQINGNELSNYVMIATGGVENLFKTLFTGKGPVNLIADGRNNSCTSDYDWLFHLLNVISYGSLRCT